MEGHFTVLEQFTNNAFTKTKKWINDGIIESETDMIRIVVLNICEECQFQCPSCPRSMGYPNRKIYMDIKTVRKIRERLDEIHFKGMISISGMGEPGLHPDLLEICSILYPYPIKIITNGFSDADYEHISLYANIYISIHNTMHFPYLKKKFADINVVFRNHDIMSDRCELIQTNRGGWIDKNTIDNSCYFPFYKICIDYDGSYLLCPDDWNRNSKKSDINIYTTDIKTYFCDYLKPVKQVLLSEGRIKKPCSQCSANGILMGDKIIEEYLCRFKKE